MNTFFYAFYMSAVNSPCSSQFEKWIRATEKMKSIEKNHAQIYDCKIYIFFLIAIEKTPLFHIFINRREHVANDEKRKHG